MYKQPIDNDRLPSEEVWARCVEFNRDNTVSDIDWLTTSDIIRKRKIRASDARFGIDKASKPMYYARSRVKSAIRNGTLVRQPCSICSNPKVDAHHPDYSKPLDVVWYCRKCHIAEHKRLKG